MTAEEERLIEILREEILIYEAFLEIKEREREAVLAFSTQDLEKLNSVQEELCDRAEELENERQEVVSRMIDPKIQGQTPRLSDLINRVDLEKPGEIARLGAELRETCLRVAESQDLSAQIIGTSAGYLRFLVDDLLRKVQPDAVAYNHDGTPSLTRETLPSLLDRKL